MIGNLWPRIEISVTLASCTCLWFLSWVVVVVRSILYIMIGQLIWWIFVLMKWTRGFAYCVGIGISIVLVWNRNGLLSRFMIVIMTRRFSLFKLGLGHRQGLVLLFVSFIHNWFILLPWWRCLPCHECWWMELCICHFWSLFVVWVGSCGCWFRNGSFEGCIGFCCLGGLIWTCGRRFTLWGLD